MFSHKEHEEHKEKGGSRKGKKFTKNIGQKNDLHSVEPQMSTD